MVRRTGRRGSPVGCAVSGGGGTAADVDCPIGVPGSGGRGPPDGGNGCGAGVPAVPRLRVAASYAPQASPAAVISVLALTSDPRPPVRYRMAPRLRFLFPPNAPCSNAPMSLSGVTLASCP